MNPTLLAREAAADKGALDPRPEDDPTPWGVYGTRLIRIVDENGEFWFDPKDKTLTMLREDGVEVWP